MAQEVVFLKILQSKIFKKTTSHAKISSSTAVGGANRKLDFIARKGIIYRILN
jgi:hypothetical protein